MDLTASFWDQPLPGWLSVLMIFGGFFAMMAASLYEYWPTKQTEKEHSERAAKARVKKDFRWWALAGYEWDPSWFRGWGHYLWVSLITCGPAAAIYCLFKWLIFG